MRAVCGEEILIKTFFFWKGTNLTCFPLMSQGNTTNSCSFADILPYLLSSQAPSISSSEQTFLRSLGFVVPLFGEWVLVCRVCN